MFALDLANIAVESGIGKARSLTAHTLDIAATGKHDVETVTVSGSDPLATDGAPAAGGGTPETAKDVSIDASAAVTISHNEVRAYIGEGAKAGTAGSRDMDESDAELYAGVRVSAGKTGKTLTQASGFAAGGETAVGAGVAVSVVNSTVEALMLGALTANNGTVHLLAKTADQDVVKAMATAIGSDMDRIAQKYKKGASDAEANANKVADGTIYENNPNQNKKNDTSSNINGELNGNSNNEQAGAAEGASNNKPLSKNILDTQNVTAEGAGKTGGTTAAGAGAATENTDTSQIDKEGKDLTGQDEASSQKIQVAAAVGLNITNHRANVVMGGTIAAATGLTALAENHGNFMVKATGVAMSFAKGANSVGAAVAVSLNQNESTVAINGNVGTSGDVTAVADLTQNLDAPYTGLLGAQSIAGAVSGADSKASVAGAVSVIVSKAKTSATVADNVTVNAGTGEVFIGATDRSKLAMRAGAISLNKGSAVGVGASFALIYSHNDVLASLGDNASVTCGGFSLYAIRRAVTDDQYTSAFSTNKLLTNSTYIMGEDGVTPRPMTADERAKKKFPVNQLGMVDIYQEDPANNSAYKIDVNITSDKLLDAIDLLNFLSSNNYYVEAIAGSIGTGGGEKAKASIGGSVAMIFAFNTVTAALGRNVAINADPGANQDADGSVGVLADSGVTGRIIAGALSFSPTKAGVALTIGFLYDEDEVAALVGAGSDIAASGTFTLSGTAAGSYLVVTAAATVSTNSGSAVGVGGAVNAVCNELRASAAVADSLAADKTNIRAGNILITSGTDLYLILGSFALAGTAGGVGVGATVAVIVDKAVSRAVAGRNAVLTATGGDIRITAHNRDKLISILAAVSVAKNTAIAGTLGVIVFNSETVAGAGGGAVLTASGSIDVLAEGGAEMESVKDRKNNAWILVVEMALSIAPSGVAVGAVISVNVFRRTVQAIVDAAAQLAAQGGNVTVRALSKDWYLGITLAVSGGSTGIAATVPVVVGSNTVAATTGKNVRMTAADSIGLIANLDSHLYIMAGGVGVGGTVGVGATVSTAVVQNNVTALAGANNRLVALGRAVTGGIQTPNRKDKRRGVVVSATASEEMVMASVAGSAGGTAAVSGVIGTLVVKNVVTAGAETGGTLLAGANETGEAAGDAASDADVTIEADDESDIYNLAGGLSAGGTVGVGATVVVVVFNRQILSYIAASSTIAAKGGVSVTAKAADTLAQLALVLAAGGTAGVAGDVNVLVFRNLSTATLNGTVFSGARGVTVKAESDSTVLNIGAALSAGGTAGVSGVAIVTYFESETNAFIADYANVTTRGGVLIEALSEETVSADAAGLTGGGVAGVGGAVDVVITKAVTRAYTGIGAVVNADGALTIHAKDVYTLVAIVATAAVGGVAGVGVSVLVSLSYNTVAAYIGERNVISAKSVEVKAESARSVITAVASFAGGGAAGVGASVSVVLVGSKMDQDSHDAIYQTDADQAKRDRVIDPQKQVDGAAGSGNGKALSGVKFQSLDALLEGDGQKAKELDPDSTDIGQGDGKGTVDESEYSQAEAASVRTISGVGGMKDQTSAQISKDAAVTAKNGGVSVLAQDTLVANLIAGSAAVGGAAGVGAGVSVAILNSGVFAVIEKGASVSASGSVKVEAGAGAASAVNAADALKKLTGARGEGDTGSTSDKARKFFGDSDEKADAEAGNGANSSTIRLIGVSAGGGFVGVGVLLASLTVFTQIRAEIRGNVNRANAVSVHADADYGQVLTITLAASGGVVGVSVSAGVTYFSADVVSAISGGAKIGSGSARVGSVSVTTGGETNAVAVASAVSVGGIAVNAGMALTINRVAVNTFIGQGVTIWTSGAVNVKTEFVAEAKAFTISFAAGGIAVGATVAMVINRLTAYTYIGTTPVGAAVAGASSATPGYVHAGSISLAGDVSGETTVLGVGVSGGVVSVNGIVALGYGNATGIVAAKGANLDVSGDISVRGSLSGNVNVTTKSAVVSGIALGATVALAILGATNRAILDAENARINAAHITLSAGTASSPTDTEAYAGVVTGTAGGVAAAFNFAVAVNGSTNDACVSGSNGKITAASMTVYAEGNTHAYALIANASVGALTVNISVAVADLRSSQYARIRNNPDIVLTGALTVTSKQNTTAPDVTKDLLVPHREKETDQRQLKSASVTFTDAAAAYILSASVGAITTAANVAKAAANAAGYAGAEVGDLTAPGGVTIQSYGQSNARAGTKNLSFGIASVGVMQATADADGTFDADLTVNGVARTGDVNVLVDYSAKSVASTTPADGGISLVEGYINIAKANTGTIATARAGGNGTLYAGHVKIKALGCGNADAQVNESIISVSGASITINKAHADVTAAQTGCLAAYLDVAADSLTVQSIFNTADPDDASDAREGKAYAAIGTTGSDDSDITVSFSGVNGAVSEAFAAMAAVVEAYSLYNNINVTGDILIQAETVPVAVSKILTPSFSLAFFDLGIMQSGAESGGTVRSYLTMASGGTVRANNLSVYTVYTNRADAAVRPGAAESMDVSLLSGKFNTAKATGSISANAHIKNRGTITVAGDLHIKVDGKAGVTALATTASFSVSVLRLVANKATATTSNAQEAFAAQTGVYNIGGKLTVESLFNLLNQTTASASTSASGGPEREEKTGTDQNEDKPAKGADVSLIGATTNTATALATVKSHAYIADAADFFVTGNVKVRAFAQDQANANASVYGDTVKISVLALGSFEASAYVHNDVKAYLCSGVMETLGDLAVLAENLPESIAYCQPPRTSIGLIDGGSAHLNAYIGGLGGSAYDETVAYIGDGSEIYAWKGSVKVEARNRPHVFAELGQTDSYNLAGFSSNGLLTYTFLYTEAAVRPNARITAIGTIEVLAIRWRKPRNRSKRTVSAFFWAGTPIRSRTSYMPIPS